VAGFTVRNGSVSASSPGGGSGAGVCCYAGSPTLTNCAITGNTATPSGGGLYCYIDSIPNLINCTISGNTASYGGGAYCVNSNPTLTNCTISGNTATSSSGGGLYCNYSVATLTNCALTDNTAASYGGAVYCYGSDVTLTNCTISGNEGAPDGAALYCTYSAGRFNVTNGILWGDTPQEIYVSPNTHVASVVTYCAVQGGYAGTGNTMVDPLFVDPDGPDNNPSTWQDNDYRLAAGSPCIDAGDNAAVPAGVVTDFAGHPRFVDDPYKADTGNPGDPPRPVVDMGAYEVQFLRGDANCDSVVDLDDINPFVMALVSQASYEARNPGCPWLNGDVNGDGAVDFDDINPFVRCLIAGGCP